MNITKTIMKKLLTSLLLSALCVSAFAQKFEDPFKDSKWDLCSQMGFTYNHNFNSPAGVSASGFGMEVMPIEMQWKGWRGGSLSIGILDMFFDWQYLQKGYSFTGYAGDIVPIGEGKGNRFDLTLGFPVGINQQFSKDFGMSLSVVPGIGFYSYHNNYVMAGVRHKEALYPTEGHVGFRLNLKAVIWYSDFGVVLRYQPIASKDLNTTLLSVGVIFRN